MIEIFRTTPTVDFMRQKTIWILFSAALMIGSLVIAWQRGERGLGIDFVGGAQIDFHFDKAVDIGMVREAFEKVGIGDASVQRFAGGPHDTAYTARFKAENINDAEEKTTKAMAAITEGAATIDQSTFVGPVIGRQVLRGGLEAFVLSLIAMLIYVSVRFDFSFALGAVIALFHDVIIATGAYILSGREISSVLLAAALTIVGYSVNDSIIVLDRIRENLTKLSKTGSARKKIDQKADIASVINLSINQTLARSVLTSVTLFLTSVALWQFGAGGASDLGFAMAIGTVVGSYSTIFIAGPIVLFWWKPKTVAA